MFAVHDEGEGLSALYLTPAPVGVVAATAAELGILEDLHDITPRLRPEPSEWLPPARVMGLSSPFELLHAPGASPERTSLMARPHLALPANGPSRVAFSFADPFHGVVYARGRCEIRAALRAWLDVLLAEEAPGGGPDVPDRALDGLLEPIDDASWRQLSLDVRPRYWTLEFSTVSVGAEGAPRLHPPTRWVAAPGGSWRAGWSW